MNTRTTNKSFLKAAIIRGLITYGRKIDSEHFENYPQLDKTANCILKELKDLNENYEYEVKQK